MMHVIKPAKEAGSRAGRVWGAALLIVAVSVVLAVVTRPHRAQAAECAGQVVTASWYGTESGNVTANGERFTGRDMTAAMPSRKHLGQHYRVTYLRTGIAVVVRINDVGPAAHLRRGIDLSEAAASRIGMRDAGVGTVCMVRVK